MPVVPIAVQQAHKPGPSLGGPGTENDLLGEEHAPHPHRPRASPRRSKIPLLVGTGHRVPGGLGEVRRRTRTFFGHSDAYSASMRRSARGSTVIPGCIWFMV